jgi:hypothetical protein
MKFSTVHFYSIRKSILVSLLLSFSILIAVVQTKAESEPPFFPRIDDIEVIQPASQFTIAPKADTRATQMRYKRSGAWSAWLPLQKEMNFPISIGPSGVGEEKFFMQYADARGRRSAIREVRISIQPPAYSNQVIDFAVEAQTCDDWGIGYGQAALNVKVKTLLNLPKDRGYKIRVYANTFEREFQGEVCRRDPSSYSYCPDVAAGLGALPWNAVVPQPSAAALGVNVEAFGKYVHCGELERLGVWFQISDEYGFQSKPIALPLVQ